MHGEECVKRMGYGGVVLLLAVLFPLIFFGASTALAEESKAKQQGRHNATADEDYQLESVTVTAQKREENVQNVPVSISVFSEAQIEDAGIKGLGDLVFHTPNLFMVKSGNHSEQTPIIRGMFNRMNPNPTVGLFVDGVAYSRHLAYDPDLNEIERIEVLKGPQGTLFGRNTEAGVINIVTKKPGNTLEGKVSAGYDEFNSQDYAAGISGPLVKDKLSLGVSGRRFTSDGFFENDYLGTDDIEYRDDVSGRATLRWTPVNAWDITLNATANDYDDGFGCFAPFEEKTHHVNLDYEGSVQNTSHGESLNMDFDGDVFRFTSISAYRNVDYDMAYDMDCTANDLMRNYYGQDQEQWTQEIRFASPDDSGPFEWLIGGFYLNESFDVKTEYDYRQGFPAWGVPPYVGAQDSTLDTRNYAFFGQATYTFWEKLGLTAGLRFEEDKKEFKGTQLDTPDVMGKGSTTVENEKTLTEWLPKVAADYQFTQDIMGYASVAKGYTAGSFNDLDASVLGVPYDPEYSWNYEVGVKSSWLGNRLTLNAAAFYIDWKDKQVFLHTGAASNIFKNAAEATSKGFELELMARPMPGLEISGGFGYTDATFDEFTDPIYDKNTKKKIGEHDYSGKHLEVAPEYNYNLAVQYRHPLGYAHTLFSRIELQGVGEYYYNFDNTVKEDAYEIVNAKLGYEGELGGYRVDFYVWVKNMFDKAYYVSAWGSEQMGWFGRRAAPQTVGASLVCRF